MKNFKLIFLSILGLILITMASNISTTGKSSVVKNKQQKEFIKKQQELDKYYSEKTLGSFVKDGKTHFRLFAPSAEKVSLITFTQPEQTEGKEYEMLRDSDGVWETALDGEQFGLYYGYKVCHQEIPCIEDILCIDPYAKAVTTFNTYFNPRRSIVVKEGRL